VLQEVQLAEESSVDLQEERLLEGEERRPARHAAAEVDLEA
jgi:hypothetical protein